MDRGNEQILSHRETLAVAHGELLTDLQSGLDALRFLVAEIDARERQLGLTFRSVLVPFAKRGTQ